MVQLSIGCRCRCRSGGDLLAAAPAKTGMRPVTRCLRTKQPPPLHRQQPLLLGRTTQRHGRATIALRPDPLVRRHTCNNPLIGDRPPSPASPSAGSSSSAAGTLGTAHGPAPPRGAIPATPGESRGLPCSRYRSSLLVVTWLTWGSRLSVTEVGASRVTASGMGPTVNTRVNEPTVTPAKDASDGT
jgi:hypothetical protein